MNEFSHQRIFSDHCEFHVSQNSSATVNLGAAHIVDCDSEK